MKKRWFFIIIMLLCLCFSMTVKPSLISACKCVEPRSVDEELEHSNAVFTGKIIEMKQGKQRKKIKFEVSKVWKGLSTSQVVLEDEISSCSRNFEKGQEYLIYANKEPYSEGNDALTTNMCSRSVELSGAAEDLLLLGKGKIPTEKVNLQKKSLPSGLYILLPMTFLIVYFFWRRRKNKDMG